MHAYDAKYSVRKRGTTTAVPRLCVAVIHATTLSVMSLRGAVLEAGCCRGCLTDLTFASFRPTDVRGWGALRCVMRLGFGARQRILAVGMPIALELGAGPALGDKPPRTTSTQGWYWPGRCRRSRLLPSALLVYIIRRVPPFRPPRAHAACTRPFPCLWVWVRWFEFPEASGEYKTTKCLPI